MFALPNPSFPPSALQCMPPTDTYLGFSFTLDSHMSSHLFASNTSYLQDSCLISSRQDTTPGALRLQFLLLNATQDFLLLLLKLDYYQFPSPPNHLTYIPEVRAWLFVGFVVFFFQFHLFIHTRSFHLICTSDSLSLTPTAKMELHC